MKSQNFCFPFSMFASLVLTIFLGGCFGGGIDPKDDPIQPGGGNEAANSEENILENNAGLNEANANAGGNDENQLNNNNSLGAEGGGNDGESINNAADENFLNEGGNANGEINMFGNNPNGGLGNNNLGKNGNQGNNSFGLNQAEGAMVNGAEDGILENQATDIDKGATDSEPLPPSDSILAPVASNPTAPSFQGDASTGAVVRYVTQGGSKLYQSPNGETLRSLEQGDHPLVNEEGEWSRTSDGFYVPAESLTAAPIPRAKLPKDWR